MEAVGVPASVIAVVDFSAKVLQACSQYAKEVKGARDDIERFRDEVTDLQRVVKQVHHLINSPGGTKLETSRDFASTIKTSEGLLSELDDRLEPAPKGKLMRRIGLRSLKWPFQSKEVEAILQHIRRCSQSISLALQVDQATVLTNVDSKIDKVEKDWIMRALPNATGAAYNSYAEDHNSTCLKNTRSEILQEIDEWIHDDQARTIFWLNGMAGTGKSTIARTTATSWDKRGYLGASFFFKRGEADRGGLSRFYTTIARQLVISIPELTSHVTAVIDKDHSITTKAAAEQFDKLILQPLLHVQITNRAIITIVIDGLDECEGDDEIRHLINQLTQSKNVLNIRIRVLITSRPELPIRLGFNAIAGSYQDLVLHEIPQSIITRDIKVFFEEELGNIRRTFNASVDENRKLGDDWPGLENIELLVQKAIPLFIFAATVCRFISQRNCANPQKQLQKVLTYETKSQESKMNATYLPPLEQQLEDLSLREQDEVLDEFQQVVGTIVLLETPLSVSALAQLINTTEETIYGRLDVLHSVLKIPRTPTSPIRLLHLSFRDFLLDPEKRGTIKFWVDEKQTHGRIAEACLRVMDSCLKEDICNLILPGSERSEVSPECVASCIPMELQYACRYWASHFGEAGIFCRHEEVLSFLKRHLLHYLEVMSLIGRFVEIFRVVKILQNLAKDGPNEMLKELLRDTHRFILMYSTVITQYPLQLYSSLRYSVPTSSILSTIVAKEKPEWIVELPDPESAWGQRQLVLENDKSWKVESITMDDSRLACLFSDGTIRIWLLDTGECIRESSSEMGQHLEGQKREIALCRNLTIITCNEKDKGGQLSLHHVDTGDVVQQYDLPPGYSKSVQISQNSQYIAFVGSDNTPVLLHIDATDCPRHIHLHNSTAICDRILSPSDNPMPRVVFSAAVTAVAFISGDSGRYAVWNLETCDCIRQHHGSNECIQEMTWCNSPLSTSVSFSLTLKSWVILAYSDEHNPDMATLEWLHSGKLICYLRTENVDINEIYFSPDNTTLALVSWNGAVESRNIATQECLAISEVEGDSYLTTLSPNFDLVASVQKDQTIIVRRNDLHVSKKREHPIDLLTLSPDHRHIALGSYGNAPCLWDVLTSDCVHELYPVTVPDMFIGWTNSFQFSPKSDHLCVYKGGFLSDVLMEIWDVKTGQHVRNIRDKNSWCEDTNIRTKFQGTISPDGRWILGIRKHGLSLWVLDGSFSPLELAFPSTVYDVMFSPDSQFIAILSSSTECRDDNKPPTSDISILTFSIEEDCHTFNIRSSEYVDSILAISSDSKLVALVVNVDRGEAETKTLRLLRMDTGEIASEFLSPAPVTCGSFFRGSAIFGWRAKGNLTFIDTTDGHLIKRLKIDTAHGFRRFDFDPDSRHINTNYGTISLDGPLIEQGLEALSLHEHRLGCGISDDESWLLWNKVKIFWLPPSYRPSEGCFEVVGSTVIIGTHSRGVLFFRFDVEELSAQDKRYSERRT